MGQEILKVQSTEAHVGPCDFSHSFCLCVFISENERWKALSLTKILNGYISFITEEKHTKNKRTWPNFRILFIWIVIYIYISIYIEPQPISFLKFHFSVYVKKMRAMIIITTTPQASWFTLFWNGKLLH